MAEAAPSAYSTRLWNSDDSNFPVLLERYQIHGIIGEGGMGTVFKGFHLNLKRFVAIKTLRIDQQKNSDLVSRFQQEMELIGQMDHPNVVRATDAGERNGIFYLVMEYLPGSDLSRLVSQKGRLDVALACELTSQAALGLDYIHAKTLVHRDIKPSNLLLTKSGHVKILDLGLARLGMSGNDGREHTPAGFAVGTYSYMSPEQASAGAKVDGRSDLYSLGCTLFKLLTGKAPFTGKVYEHAAQILFAHCHTPIHSLAEFQAIPADVQAVLLKMTAKDPMQRYQSGREVAAALVPFVGEIAGSAMQPHAVALGPEEIAETPVRPLTDPLPEELSRLTESIQATPRNTPTAPSSSAATIAATPRGGARRWWIGAGVLAGLSMPLVLLAALAPFRDPGEKKEPPPDDRKPAEVKVSDIKGPEVIALPVAASLRDMDLVKTGQHHELLKLKEFPPVLIGLQKGDVLASARWSPGDEKLELNPTGTVLAQLGTTNKEKPSFVLQTRMNQQLWHQNVGLFWGYQENAQVKNLREPGKVFAQCQVLQLKHRLRPVDSAKIFSIQRSKAHLGYARENRLVILLEEEIASHELVDLNLGNEQIFSLEVKDGRLKQAEFAGKLLKKVYYGGVSEKAGPNGRFTPPDYQGSFGVFSASAAVTVRNASVLMHNP